MATTYLKDHKTGKTTAIEYGKTRVVLTGWSDLVDKGSIGTIRDAIYSVRVKVRWDDGTVAWHASHDLRICPDCVSDNPNKAFSQMCTKCEKQKLTYTPTDGGHVEHDTCLGVLPGVISACCGHGTHEGHIIFENGVVVKFTDPTIYVKEMKEV